MTKSFPADLFQNAPDKAMFIKIASLKVLSNIEDLKSVAVKVYEEGKNEINNATDLFQTMLNSASMASSRYQNVEYLYWLGLPLPNQFNEDYTHQWSQQTSVMADIATMMSDKITEHLPNLSKLGAKAYSQVSDSQSLTKAVINPGYFQEYEATGPRTFLFTYDLMPNNFQEAKTIEEIILLLKGASAPQRLSTSAVLVAPTFFEIVFCNQTLDNLIRPRPCVLTQISVNYGPSGFIETTGDGRPKAITLSLTFQEKEAMMMGDWAVKRTMQDYKG